MLEEAERQLVAELYLRIAQMKGRKATGTADRGKILP